MRADHRNFLHLAALIAVILAPPARAEDWRPLDDAGINAALAARVLQYPDAATQNFFSDGRTLYEVKAGTSWGKWWVERGRYCSTWPPSETPSCYNLAARGLEIRFSDGGGDNLTIGRYVDP